MSTEPEVLLVADAGPGAGLGHIARCSAVAAALWVRGVRCRCLAVGASDPPDGALHWSAVPSQDDIPASGPDLLFLDSYRIDHGLARTRTGAHRLVVMHDTGPLPDGADLTITSDPALAGSRPAVVGGLRMTCLRADFWGLPDPPPVAEQIRSILVTTGGGNPGGHAVPVALALLRGLEHAEVTLVRGPQADFPDPAGLLVLDRPDSLLEPISRAELVVTGAGNGLLEAIAVGRPTLALILAENQRAIAEALARAGATQLVDPVSPDAAASAAIDLAADAATREGRVRQGRELIDGYGALRTAYLIARLILDVKSGPRRPPGGR